MIATEIAAVIDTSAIIQLREEWYSPDVFDSLNQEVTKTAEQRCLVTVDRVIRELETQAEDQSRNVRGNGVLTASWAKGTLTALNDVVPLPTVTEIRTLTSVIATQHQTWRNGQPADPMLLAAAEVLGCAIVSGESLKDHGPRRPETDFWERSDLERGRPILQLDQDPRRLLDATHPAHEPIGVLPLPALVLLTRTSPLPCS